MTRLEHETLTQEVMHLQSRVARLETVLRRLSGDALPREGAVPSEPLNQTQLLAWLKASGVVRDPTAEECRVAAAWDALPEADKQAHIDGMQRLVLDIPLSQIIIEQRR